MTNTPRHAAPARPERDGYRPSRALPSRALDDLDPLPPRALGSSDAVGESPAPLLPHALPELVALFPPLAAWIIASRRDDWHELLAATFVTVAIALPILVISALVEVFVTPHLLLAISS